MRRWWSRFLAWILTEDLASVIEGDLMEESRRRRAGGGWRAEMEARLWVAWQLLTLPYVRLALRARRLKDEGRGRGGARRPEGCDGTDPPRPTLEWEREGMMRTMMQDLKVAVRSFARRPGFGFLATVTLALGIGAHAALFSVVDGVLLRPVDLPRPHELVVAQMRTDGEFRSLTGPNAVDLVRETGVFASATAFANSSLTIENLDGTRERRPAVLATPGVFETVGVPLQLGRPWGPETMGTGGLSAVVISDRLWRGRFGGDPGVVGSTLAVNGTSVLVTGVLSPDFTFPTLDDVDLVFPPPLDPADIPRAGLGGYTVLARLRPDVAVDRARQQVLGVWEGMRAQHPGDLLDYDVTLMDLQGYLVRGVRPALLALLGATSLLLLLACANVANLMVARGIRRDTEMSVRASLGAGRSRLVRQLLVESGVLAAFAGIAGILLASGLLDAVRALAPPEIPRIQDARLSLGPALVALSAALGCALVTGLVPALRTSSTELAGALRSATRTTAGRGLRRFQGALVVAQVAVAVVLCTGAGLLVRSFSTLSDVDPGYRTEGVITASIATLSDFETDPTAWAEFYRRLEDEVAELPGVTAVGTTLRPPFAPGEISAPLRLADRGSMTLETAPRAEVGIVSDGYIEALGIPLLRGRNFTEEDRRDGPQVVLLSQSLARALFGDEDPVGRRLTPVLGEWENATDWAEVVGVVGDIRLQSLDAAPVGTIYLATPQRVQPYGTLVVQTDSAPTQVTQAVRETVLRVEPRLLEPTVRTMASLRAESLARPRFNLLLLGTFSVLALALSAVGIYGLLSYSVAARRLELGVRMAFGADRRSVLGLVIREGMKLTGIGLVVGLLGALLASRALSGLLYGIPPTDVPTYTGTLLGITGMAFAGCLMPALRAARGSTVEALQGE